MRQRLDHLHVHHLGSMPILEWHWHGIHTYEPHLQTGAADEVSTHSTSKHRLYYLSVVHRDTHHIDDSRDNLGRERVQCPNVYTKHSQHDLERRV